MFSQGTLKQVESRVSWARLGAVLAAVVLVLASGCGQTASTQPEAKAGSHKSTSAKPSDTGTANGVPNSSPSPAPLPTGFQKQWPACSEVWKPSGTIPAHYHGCLDKGRAFKADLWPCSFGAYMTTYSDRYYGVLGSKVNDAGGPLAKSKQYQHNYALCTG